LPPLSLIRQCKANKKKFADSEHLKRKVFIMSRVFAKGFDASKMLGLQVTQYSERLLLAGTVPANSSIIAKATVSNLGHFYCMFMTGKYSTLKQITDAPTGATYTIDTGVQYLRGLLRDSAGQKTLFSDFIPLDLFLSPGRCKVDCDNSYRDILDTTGVLPREIALAAAKGETLFYPQEFEYLFPANADILLEVKNSSNADNSFEIMLHGTRILASASVKGVRRSF
jgi:hypothetical protein